MIRNFTLLVAIICLSLPAFSQLGGTHNYLDTSYIAPRNLAQQTEFLNNKTGFPARPRDMWQLGVFLGFPYVDGDCPAALKGAGSGMSSVAWGGGLSVRKAVGYAISMRASLAYYNILGLDYQRNRNFNNSPVIEKNYINTRGYIHNFHTTAVVPSLEALVSLNNIMFHSRQSKWNAYVLAGYTAFAYQTKMDVLKNDGSIYPFESINTDASRSDIRKALRKMLDGSYETLAETNNRRPNFGKYNLRNSFSVGGGFEYRVGKSTSVGLEYKRIITRDDYIDGWFRQSGDLINEVFTSEWDNIGFLSLSINKNIGNPKKRVPPLWWMNPLEFAYSELNNPKHMQLPKVKLDDSDGDGVTDQFDQEPNTPAGAPVDSHGVSRDSDGDGVPDYRDKELLTQQNCFPVDEDGVGSCPEPDCCKEVRNRSNNGDYGSEGCKLTDLPSINFKGNSVKLSKDAQDILNTVAAQLKANPGCKVKVSGHGATSKSAQQLSWDRVNAVIRYLVERQGLSDTRIIFEYGTEGDANTVDMIGTDEQGPNRVPAPHPELQKTK